MSSTLALKTISRPDTVPDRIIDAKERRQLVPYSDMHTWRLERAGKFPRRIQIGPNRVGWSLREVMAWIAEKKAERQEALTE